MQGFCCWGPVQVHMSADVVVDNALVVVVQRLTKPRWYWIRLDQVGSGICGMAQRLHK